MDLWRGEGDSSRENFYSTQPARLPSPWPLAVAARTARPSNRTRRSLPTMFAALVGQLTDDDTDDDTDCNHDVNFSCFLARALVSPACGIGLSDRPVTLGIFRCRDALARRVGG